MWLPAEVGRKGGRERAHIGAIEASGIEGAGGGPPLLSSHFPAPHLQWCDLVGVHPSLGAHGWGPGGGDWLGPAIQMLDAPAVIWAETQWVAEGVERGHKGLSSRRVL